MSIDVENGIVELAHGSGGRAMHQLIQDLFVKELDNEILRAGEDQATLNKPDGRIVVATDSHVISPLFFPGGDIGSLAVHGTINDVVMSGARPVALTAAFILEEGFPLKDLKRIVQSMAKACKQSHVSIVTGDTKVVERGNGDGVFINTTGIGVIEHNASLSAKSIRPDDKIILSGSIGEHGMTILAQREGLSASNHEQDTSLKSGSLTSDSAALDGLVADMLPYIEHIRCMRDPTRGGLAATLNELAQSANLNLLIQESEISIQPAVAAHCEILGLDPLYLANEGKLVAICDSAIAGRLLETMRDNPLGRDAAIIGEVSSESGTYVEMQTLYGGRRLVDWRYSDPLPRIC
jgi:hydrogenase expression/formation protein HypE